MKIKTKIYISPKGKAFKENKLKNYKVDVFLLGNGFRVKDLKNYLDTKHCFKDKLELIQEFGEIRTKGPDKGKKSKFGMCWINEITLKQLRDVGLLFKTYKVEDITININQKDIENQTCLFIDTTLILTASMLGASIEIVDF